MQGAGLAGSRAALWGNDELRPSVTPKLKHRDFPESKRIVQAYLAKVAAGLQDGYE